MAPACLLRSSRRGVAFRGGPLQSLLGRAHLRLQAVTLADDKLMLA